MSRDKNFKITQYEGQRLLEIAANFILPEKLGDLQFNIADRSQAALCVNVHLYRELKSRSPALVSTKGELKFGPTENFEERVEQHPITGRASLVCVLKRKDAPILVRLSEDAFEGAYYCLLVGLHPASQCLQPSNVQSEALWPCAEKLGIVPQLHADLGITEASRKRKKLLVDERPDEPIDLEIVKIVTDSSDNKH